MKIGILGSGDVAKSLAAGFLAHGHEPMLGTRDRVKLEGWVAQNPKGAAGSFADAARFGELLVLAVKGTVAADALRAAGIINLAGKPVIDATNPIADAPPANGVLRFFTNLDERYGRGRGSPSDRATVHALVHPGPPAARLGSRIQAAELTGSGLNNP